jgi:hypothetical protein
LDDDAYDDDDDDDDDAVRARGVWVRVASSRRRVVIVVVVIARRARWRIEGWDASSSVEGWARGTRRMRIFRSARARVRVRVVFVVLKCTYARG